MLLALPPERREFRLKAHSNKQLLFAAPRAEESIEDATALAHQFFSGFAESSAGYRRSDSF